MSRLTLKQPSEQLKQKLDNIVKHIQNCATLINEAFALGLKEGFSEKEIGKMIREQLARIGYNPRTIRRALPPSIKDISKTRKDYLTRNQNNNRKNEDIMSSFESRTGYDENQQDASVGAVNDLQNKIKLLEGQLSLEHAKNEDLTIQCNNAIHILGQLRSEIKAVHDTTNILIITKDNFPHDSGRVFSSQDHVFAVEFRGTKILDISVKEQRQIQDQEQYGFNNLQRQRS
jgi:hypothetical protein